MNKISNLLLISALLFTVLGCRTNEVPADSRVKSEVLYSEALAALENHSFIIEANEFYFPSSAKVKSTSGNYISMQDNQATMNFTQDVFPKKSWDHLITKNDNAQMTKEQRKKNGNMLFAVTIEGNKEWLRYKLLITLYKKTNQCFVQANDRSGRNEFSFRGVITQGTPRSH